MSHGAKWCSHLSLDALADAREAGESPGHEHVGRERAQVLGRLAFQHTIEHWVMATRSGIGCAATRAAIASNHPPRCWAYLLSSSARPMCVCPAREGWKINSGTCVCTD